MVKLRQEDRDRLTENALKVQADLRLKVQRTETLLFATVKLIKSWLRKVCANMN